MRVQLRIISGSLRGRKLVCNFGPDLRPTPDMVRQALFNILGNAVPDRLFIDIFAGSGVVGMEALSRGASKALFLERDLRLAQEIERNLRTFAFQDRAKILRADAYRWAESWKAPPEPVNIFLSPPFADLEERPDAMLGLLQALKRKIAFGSVLVLQSEKNSTLDGLPFFQEWEQRRYGRNVLLLWEPSSTEEMSQPPVQESDPGMIPDS